MTRTNGDWLIGKVTLFAVIGLITVGVIGMVSSVELPEPTPTSLTQNQLVNVVDQSEVLKPRDRKPID